MITIRPGPRIIYLSIRCHSSRVHISAKPSLYRHCLPEAHPLLIPLMKDSFAFRFLIITLPSPYPRSRSEQSNEKTASFLSGLCLPSPGLQRVRSQMVLSMVAICGIAEAFIVLSKRISETSASLPAVVATYRIALKLKLLLILQPNCLRLGHPIRRVLW